jgi:KaiC/GvpD/RAD55 family RecA-like ATPase
MNTPPDLADDEACFHAVYFYRSSAALAERVVAFLADGFAQGAPAVVIATSLHRARIVSQLRARAIDVLRAQIDGKLMLFDAHAVLAQFMRGGRPDPLLFRSTVVPVLELARRNRPPGPLRAYGEMVNLLWNAGLEDAALELEMLWNQLARTQEFALLCGYGARKSLTPAACQRISHHHTHLVSDRKPSLHLH